MTSDTGTLRLTALCGYMSRSYMSYHDCFPDPSQYKVSIKVEFAHYTTKCYHLKLKSINSELT